MQTPYEKFLAVIPDHPAQRIMHFVDGQTPLTPALASLTHDRHYDYLLLCFDAAAAETLAQQHAASPHIKVKHVTHDQARFHIQAKMYDFVFVEAAIPDEAAFLRKVYTAMKNAAILFVLTAGKYEEIERWRIGTEENFYVAFNTFELSEGLQVVSAKKMHGWGG